MWRIIIFFSCFSLIPMTSSGFCLPKETGLEVWKEGRQLKIRASLPEGITEFELRIESDRNRPVSRASSISPFDPDSVSRRIKYAGSSKEIWFPVIDMKTEPGMEAVCEFSGRPAGEYIFGGPYYREARAIGRKITIPGNKLEYWENSLITDTGSFELVHFYLRRIFPVILREFSYTFDLLSEDWGGEISFVSYEQDRPVILASQTLSREKPRGHVGEAEGYKGSGINRDRLICSLKLLIKDGLRRQNDNPSSPMYGSLFTFYDLNARTHRTAYWTWGGAPFVSMALGALELKEIQESFDTAVIVKALKKIGEVYLNYQVRETGHPSLGSFLVIWSRSYRGYTKWIGTSDSGIIVRWALIPLFIATGDSTYLEASEFWCRNKANMLDTVDILPHYFLYDENVFADRILDETGWDPEGHAALYQLTGDNRYRESARVYMDNHMRIFQREDGLWQRSYNIKTKEVQETSRMVRGLGWAMEGLLAMNSMYPDSVYLMYAQRMADTLMRAQRTDGSWSFVYNLPPEKTGITEKGTALWSLLFYKLYKTTGYSAYLTTARKALLWCLDHQYTGPDPEAVGGLSGRTNASMVGIRPFFEATCVYTTAFFGLAILEELALMEEDKYSTSKINSH